MSSRWRCAARILSTVSGEPARGRGRAPRALLPRRHRLDPHPHPGRNPPAPAGFVPNEKTAGVMRRMGVPPAARVRFPVQSFAEHEGRLSPDLAAGARPQVVHRALRVRHAETTAQRLLTERTGADDRWGATGAPPARRTRPPPSAPRPCSAGPIRCRADDDAPCGDQQSGATTQAIAACPMVVSQIVRAGEEFRAASPDAGALAERPTPYWTRLRSALDGGARYRHWSESMRTLARRDAARVSRPMCCGQPSHRVPCRHEEPSFMDKKRFTPHRNPLRCPLGTANCRLRR